MIANGALGEFAALPAEMEIKIGKLKFKPAMEDNHVLEMLGKTVMSDHALEGFLKKVLLFYFQI